MKKILFGILCMLLCANSYALPAGYTQLEYLESTGTQCINTGVILTSDNVVYEWNSKDLDFVNNSNEYTTIFGAESSYDSTLFTGLLHGVGGSRVAYIGDTWGQPVEYNPDNNFDSWRFVINSDHTQYLVKDEVKNTTTSWTGTLNKVTPIALFCNFVRGDYYGQGASIAFRFFRITDNGRIVFNGIPARRDSDGALGMYDTVTKTLLTNVGTGTFIAGPEIAVASTSYVQGAYETLNSAKMAKAVANTIEWTQGSTSNGIITSVVGAGDKFQVSRTDVTIPVGSPSSPTGRMGMWLE